MQHGLPLARSLGAALYAVGDDAFEALHAAAPDLPISRLRPEPGNLWLAKLRILRHAVERFGRVVWFDWDARQLRALPADFWQRLRGPFMSSVRQYHRRKCHWRKECKRSLCGGAFLYCDSVAFVDVAIAAMEAHRHTIDDEQALAWAADQHAGGWHGLQYWHDHFDPPWYTIKGIIFPAPEAVFTAS